MSDKYRFRLIVLKDKIKKKFHLNSKLVKNLIKKESHIVMVYVMRYQRRS